MSCGFLVSLASCSHNLGAGKPCNGMQNTDRLTGVRIVNIFIRSTVGDGEAALRHSEVV